MMPQPAHIALVLSALSAAPALGQHAAVAVNKATGNFGYAYGKDGKGAAERRAIEFCREYSKGAAGCDVVMTTRSCGAVVRSGRSLHVGEARRREAAEAAATKICTDAQQGGCQTVALFCARDN